MDYRSLAGLSSDAAIQIGNYIRGKTNFPENHEMHKVLQDASNTERLKDNPTYVLMWHEAVKTKGKPLKKVSELALELKLLSLELNNINYLNPTNPRERARLDEMLNFFCSLTTSALRREEPLRHYLVA